MSECIVCKEVVTNPVCISCVEEEIKAWLFEVKPELVEELYTKTEEIDSGFGETNCILCPKWVSVCTYCYTKHIFDWLKIRAPELSKSFRTIFNFNYYFY